MATKDRWNQWGQQWLATLEEMAAEAESPEEELTTFEHNLMEQLRTMVVEPKDEPPTTEVPIYIRIEGAFAQYIREMSNNNGVSLTDYALDVLGKGIAADKKTSVKTNETPLLDDDYVATEGGVWIRVKNISIRIFAHPDKDGVDIAAYTNGDEMSDAINEMFVAFPEEEDNAS